MWNKKKSVAPQARNLVPTNLQTNQPTKLAPTSWEGTTKTNKDVMHPTGAMVERATSRLGSNLHVKGEISGNEDLHIDGTVEGLVQIAERKLTVGGTAKLTADITAREETVYGSVKGNGRGKGKIEIKKKGSGKGELRTPQTVMQNGADFKGSM